MTESLSISGVVFLVFLLVRYLDDRRKCDAAGLGVLALFLVLLRPAFLYLVGVLAVFWAAVVFEAPEKENILWGFLGTGISVAGVLVWCAFNFFNCGRFTLSVVTDINLLHMLVLNGSVETRNIRKCQNMCGTKWWKTRRTRLICPGGPTMTSQLRTPMSGMNMLPLL